MTIVFSIHETAEAEINEAADFDGLNRGAIGEEVHMPSAAATTVTKMLETLPDQLQDRVLEHLRDYIEDLREEAQWSESFSKTQGKLVAAARQARRAVAEGRAVPLDIEKL